MTPDIVAVELPIDDVYPNPRHYREVRAENVKTLAASIKVAGQLDPITVYRDGDIYFVDAGHHRLEAVKALGLKTIRAIVLDVVDEAKSATIMTASNMHFPESALEKSRGSQLLLTTGVKPVNVAALVGVDQNTVSMAAKGLAMAKDYAEDMTLERLAVLPEFEGDEEAAHKIMTAGEDRWRGVYNELSRKQKVEQSFADAQELVKKAKVKLIEQAGPEHEFIERGLIVPDDAKFARIVRYDWSGSVEILWFKKAVAKKVDPEETKRIEAAALREAELEKAHDRRLTFSREYLAGESKTLSNALREFAGKAWEDGSVHADVADIDKALSEITGLFPRFYAAVLSKVEKNANSLLTCNPYNFGWYCEQYGATTVAYFKALKEVDYKPIPAETDRLDEIVDALAGDPCEECQEQECAECEHALTCPACDGDGREPDKTGGGHHGTCKVCDGSKVVNGTYCRDCEEPNAYGPDEKRARYDACVACVAGGAS